MLNSSFFHAQLQPTVSPVLEICPTSPVVPTIMKAASGDIDYLLLMEHGAVAGVIRIQSLLMQADRLAVLTWEEFVETNVRPIDIAQFSSFSKQNLTNQYLLLYDGQDCVGIIDRKANDLLHQHTMDNTLTIIDSILDSCHNGIIAMDEQKNIVCINKTAAEICDVDAAKVVGRPLPEAIPACSLSDFLFQGDPQINHKSALNDKIIEANRTILKIHGRSVGAISVFQDVTDSEKTQRELALIRESEKNLEAIIENSYDGIYITNAEGLTLKVNRSYNRITGIPKETIVGRYMKDLVREGVLPVYVTDEVVKQKKPVTRTQTAPNKKNLIITGSPIFDENGEVKQVITNVRDITELVTLEKELQLSKMASSLYQEELFRDISSERIVCDSKQTKEVLKLAKKVSSKASTVLILGETGVGKEIIARYIHMNSLRKDNNYIKINCAAIPANLLESELFGYAPGAFTNASSKGKVGLFELADRGTLFLDEIGEMPLGLQSTLLRVLQDGEVTRVGDTKSKKVDVRIIAATNRNLEEMIARGTFRSDLFYRLNVFSITIPPLRERLDEIPGLAEHFIRDLNEKYNENKIITSNFINQLMDYEWPGNIREMGNFIEKQFVMSDEDVIDSFLLNYQSSAQSSGSSPAKITVDGIMPLNDAVREVETILITRAMRRVKTTYKAAALLGVSQPTLFRKYKEYCKTGEDEGDENRY